MYKRQTRGSAINEDDLERIDKLNELRGVIVFTDPDYNGERIRKIIMEAVPTAKHAFLNRGEASPKSKTRGRSLGVEHANFEDIQKALARVLGSYCLLYTSRSSYSFKECVIAH